MRSEPINTTNLGSMADRVSEVARWVQVLYSSNDPNQQATANTRLMEIQSSPDIWDICWKLLDPGSCSSQEIQFFAANTIVLKINSSWSQLPKDWVQDVLRVKIFQALYDYANSMSGYKLVTDRLALALAALAVHSIPTFWPDAIEQIMRGLMVQRNQTEDTPPKRVRDILLKILLYIPEEYSLLIPDQADRAKLNERMTKAGPEVFKFLYTLLMAPEGHEAISPNTIQTVLKCLTSWALHSQTSMIELEIGRRLIDVVYNMVSDEEYCSGACAVLAATFTSQKAENYKNTVIEFIPKLAGLKNIISNYTSQLETECAIKVYSLVVNFSENHSKLFLELVIKGDSSISQGFLPIVKNDILDIIHTILECSDAPGIFGIDEKYSDMTFPFWFSFLENFYYYNDSYNDIICETFDPLVDSLLELSLKKLQYPDTESYHQRWSSDQRESFRCYRQDLGDNISLLIHFPRSRERILSNLHEAFRQELKKMIQNDSHWQGFESVLFAIKSIAESIPFDENNHLPDMIVTLSHLTFKDTHALLYCTVAEMVSAYSDWLYSHSSHLAAAFQVLFQGITSPNHDMRLFSTLSLKDLTTECQLVLNPYALQLVKACSEAILRPDLQLPTCEKSRLMHAIGTSLPMCPADNILDSLNSLVTPLLHDLNTNSEHNDPKLDEMGRPIILDRLIMLNSLIESFRIKSPAPSNDYEADGDENDSRLDPNRFEQEVDVTQLALNLVRQYVPVLVKISIKYKADEQIIGIISNTIKRCAKSLGTDVKDILKDLLTIIVNSYDPLLNPHILEGCIPLYTLFRNDQSVHPLLRDAFENVSENTLKACVDNPLQQLSVTVENYFRLATIVCKRLSSFFTSENFLRSTEYIYKLAVASLELPEKKTLNEVCNFLQQFRAKSIGVDPLNRILLGGLNQMLSNIFNVMGGSYSTPRNAVDHAIDLLHAIIDVDEIKEPLKIIIEKDNFPSCYVTKEQKSNFIHRIVHEKNRRKFKDICFEFVLVVRNLHRQ